MKSIVARLRNKSGVYDEQPVGHSALPQAIRKASAAVSIKLGVRDQTAGVVENGIQEGLHAPATRTLDVRPVQHVRLPYLIASFGFELLMRWRSHQLAGGQVALFEEAMQSRGRDVRRVGP